MAIDYSDLTSGKFREAKGGDFAPTIKWDETPDFEGVYVDSENRTIKGESRVIHVFEDADGNAVESFGTAILDSRLNDVRKDVGAPALVKISYLGKTAKTKAGRLIHDFRVLYAPVEG